VLFAGMVLTGSVTVGLITSAIASLVVPDNQIGLRPSSSPRCRPC